LLSFQIISRPETNLAVSVTELCARVIFLWKHGSPAQAGNQFERLLRINSDA